MPAKKTTTGIVSSSIRPVIPVIGGKFSNSKTFDCVRKALASLGAVL